MPMLFTWRDPDHVSGSDFFNGAASALHPAAAGSDYEILSQRVRVPAGSRAGFEGDADPLCARWGLGLKKGIDAHRPGKPISRSFFGGL